MANSSAQIVQKLWSYCSVLRDDGLSYGDYVEQLTYLLFLKMAHERTQAPWNQKSSVPVEYAWPSLLAKDGDALEIHYRRVLEQLGKHKGMLGIIFRKAQNKIQDPAKLRRLAPRRGTERRRGGPANRDGRQPHGGSGRALSNGPYKSAVRKEIVGDGRDRGW